VGPAFGRGADAGLLDPLTHGDRLSRGDCAQKSTQNAFANPKTPIVWANHPFPRNPQAAAFPRRASW